MTTTDMLKILDALQAAYEGGMLNGGELRLRNIAQTLDLGIDTPIKSIGCILDDLGVNRLASGAYDGWSFSAIARDGRIIRMRFKVRILAVSRDPDFWDYGKLQVNEDAGLDAFG